MIRILFVCLGNICRSPMAEGILNQFIKAKGLEAHFEVDSCGTIGYHSGSLPDPRARQVCIQKGHELTHKARQIQKGDYAAFDYILAMDQQNLSDIESRKPEAAVATIRLLRSYGMHPSGELTVPDPYYDEPAAFEAVYEMLMHHCEQLLNELIAAHRITHETLQNNH